jgi:Zn-finger nucleic acid-binding protein
MRCPNGDSELVSHTTEGEHNLTVAYSTCPVCTGTWTDSFAANFIKLPPRGDEALPPGAAGPPPVCPVCTKPLIRATGENIPDHVIVYTCPEGHGYFFPAGQLAAFKKAQTVKIEYHKLWNVPLSSVKSVLLSVLLVLVLTGGLVTGFFALQSRQTTSSQAQGLLKSQRARITATSHSVLMSAQTQYDAVLTVHIPSFNNFVSELQSTDHRTHTITINNIPSGNYRYYYVISVGGEGVQSESYTFIMP